MKKWYLLIIILYFNCNSFAQNYRADKLYGTYSFENLFFDAERITIVQLCENDEFALWRNVATQYSDMITIVEPSYMGRFILNKDTIKLFFNNDVLEFIILDSLNIKYVSNENSVKNVIGHRVSAFYPNHECSSFMTNFEKTKWYISEVYKLNDTIYKITHRMKNKSHFLSEPILLNSVKFFK